MVRPVLNSRTTAQMPFRIGFRGIDFNSGIFLSFFFTHWFNVPLPVCLLAFVAQFPHANRAFDSVELLCVCPIPRALAPCLCRVIKIPHSKMSFRFVHREMECKFNQFTFANCCRRWCAVRLPGIVGPLCVYINAIKCVLCAHMRAYSFRNCVRECLIKIKNLCARRLVRCRGHKARAPAPRIAGETCKNVNRIRRKSTAINIDIYGSKQFHFIDPATAAAADSVLRAKIK